MRDLSKKYLHKRTDDHPDIGNFVHWFILEKKIPKIAIANHLQVIPTTLNQYFKQPSLQFSIIWRISRAINYNMVMDLGERLGIAYETKVEKKLKEELAQKDELIKKMEIQLETLREMRG